MGDLDGRRVVVTGAAKGIGRSTVTTLLARSARVAAIDLEFAGKPWDGPVQTFTADVADEAALGAAIEAAVTELGGLDGLVNNAGIMIEKPLEAMTVAEFDRLIAVNLRGTFLAIRAAITHLRAYAGAGKARIVNIASELAYLGRPEYAAYCASKGAVISLTRALARELAPDILVNAVAPGPTDTDMLRSEKGYAAWKETAHGIPLGRVGEAEDVARMVAVLLGPDSAFMTGQIVGVNGGAVMQ